MDTPSRSGTTAVTSSGWDATRWLYSAIARPILIHFQREERAAWRQCAREPDAGVAGRRADLEDARRADGRREHSQQRADFSIDEGEVPLRAGTRDVVEHRAMRAVQRRQIPLHGIRNNHSHRRYSSGPYQLKEY